MITSVVMTWTDAPEDYDGFGTRTYEVLGLVPGPMGSRQLRQVTTPTEHVLWQRSRYASGGYLSASEAELPRVQHLWAGPHPLDIDQ
jgi:hypothetical protein